MCGSGAMISMGSIARRRKSILKEPTVADSMCFVVVAGSMSLGIAVYLHVMETSHASEA